ncbi:MAG: hypothetical protein CMJ52_02615 [Planctomycetaceae bacterium]|nr:hypothetical protein [Planctomycetaceae bacterium]
MSGTVAEVSDEFGPIPDPAVGDWASVEPLTLALVALAGMVIMLFGGRLFRPSVTLGAAVVGAVFGIRLAAATRDQALPAWLLAVGIPPIAWIVGLPLLGGVLAAIFVRVMLALMVGVVGSGVVLLVSAVLLGAEPVPSTGDGTPIGLRFQQSDETGIDGNLESAATAAGDRLADAAMDAMAAEGLERLRAARRRLGEMAEAAFGRIPAWWESRTANVSKGTLDLVLAAAVVVGLGGFLLALLFPKPVATIGTSLLGGWLVMAAGAAGWARYGRDGAPPAPFLMLLAWGVLAGAGLLVQGKGKPRGETGSKAS